MVVSSVSNHSRSRVSSEFCLRFFVPYEKWESGFFFWMRHEILLIGEVLLKITLRTIISQREPLSQNTLPM